jgi:ABC-type glutathione transport system ATPase component
VTAELRSFTVAIDTGRWRDTVLTEVDMRLEAAQVTALLGGPGDGKTMISYALRIRFDALGQQVGEDLGSAPLRGPTEKRASRSSDARQVGTSFVSASHLVGVALYDSHDEIESPAPSIASVSNLWCTGVAGCRCPLLRSARDRG